MSDTCNIIREQISFQLSRLSTLRKPLQVFFQAPLTTLASGAVLYSIDAPLVLTLGVTAYAAQKIWAQGIVSYPKTPQDLIGELDAMKTSDYLRTTSRSHLNDLQGCTNWAKKKLRSLNYCLDLRQIPLDNFQEVSNILNSAQIPSCLKRIIFKPDSLIQFNSLIEIFESHQPLTDDFILEIIGNPLTYVSNKSFVKVHD